MKPRFKEIYEKEILPTLMEKYGHTNIHQAGKLTKIVLNMGVGEATQDKKHIESAVTDMGRLA